MSRSERAHIDELPPVLPLGFGHPEPAESIIKTAGNALLFSYEGHVWILTCTPLVESVPDAYQLKAIWRPEATNYFLVLRDRSRRRIPADSGFMLYHFAEASSFSKQYDSLRELAIPDDNSFAEGAPMSLRGFEANRLRPERIYSRHSLPESRLEAKHLEAELDIRPDDYSRLIRRQRVAELTGETLPEMTGALVSFETENGPRPAGLVTGTGTLKLKRTESGPVEDVNVCTYVSLRQVSRLIDRMMNKA